jgi:hypothetical protein
MGVFQIFALLAALLPLRAFGAGGPAAGRVPSKQGWVALASAGALVAVFAGYVVAFAGAVAEVHPASVLAGLPIRFVNAITKETVRASRADDLLLLALAEAVLLGIFLFNLGALGPRTRRATIGILAAGLAAAALATPAADSGDPYFYVGLATLGAHAYAPPATPFSGDLRAINASWGTPMFASTYGPVWIAVSALLVAPLGTLAAKLYAFKVLGLGSVLGCAYLARRLGAARVVVAGIACNPALYLMYAANAHNDLFAVDLVLAAMLVARRGAVLAFAFALAASLVKITLAPVALLAVAPWPSLRARASFAALLALGVGIVYGLHGGVMWHALISTSRAFAHPASPLDIALRAGLVALALASSAWTVAKGRVRAQSAWAPPAFGDSALPSYATWGLPLALTSTPVATVYLVTLPFLTFFQCTALPVTPALDVAGDGFILATIAVVAYRLRPRSICGEQLAISPVRERISKS